MSNMYLACFDNGVFVVDPSVSPDKVSYEVTNVIAILITHGHYDHIKYVDEWHERFPDAPIYMNPADQVLLGDPGDNCSYMDGLAKVFDFPYVKAEGSIDVGGIDIDVLSTPGHTMGSVCYMFREEDKQYLFTGDTVFAGSVGRTDMAGGSFALLNKSIEAVSKLDPETLIFPGHGPESTVGDEVKYNPFFAG